ncbi:MAG: type ISP restriction/modification enzyme [Roseiarcus sp.]|jgi:hypothetical protein
MRPPRQRRARSNPSSYDRFTQAPPADIGAPAYTRRDAIIDEGLPHFVAAGPGEPITDEDLFHYVYGLLRSEDYRERDADNPAKQSAPIPPYEARRIFGPSSKRAAPWAICMRVMNRSSLTRSRFRKAIGASPISLTLFLI